MYILNATAHLRGFDEQVYYYCIPVADYTYERYFCNLNKIDRLITISNKHREKSKKIKHVFFFHVAQYYYI